MPETLLQIRNLKTHFNTDSGVAKAVDVGCARKCRRDPAIQVLDTSSMSIA